MRKGFGTKPHTKRGHNKRGAQRRNEAARRRAMTPLFPPQAGSRRFRFSSAEPNEWSTQRSLPADEIQRELRRAA